MIYLKKFVCIAASSAVFVFFFMIGDAVRRGEDFSGAGVRGIVRIAGGAIDAGASLIGAVPLDYGIMGLALFGGLYAAVYIWRDDWLF